MLDIELFARIFSDAQVVDIDMSQWDKKISFWIVSDHYREWQTRMPLLVIDFLSVTKFNIETNNSAVPMDAEKHLQWTIYESSIDKKYNGYSVYLTGHTTSPRVTIECGKIEFKETSHTILDALQPGWNKPYAPFASVLSEKRFSGIAPSLIPALR
jgi:hypothetical protein